MRYPTLQHSLKVARQISPGSVQQVIDIGAQRKTQFLMDVYPDLTHHLFEPVATYHSDLETNYQSLGIAYELHKFALGDQDSTLFLHNQSLDGSGRITHSQIKTAPDSSLPHLIEINDIPVKRLDSVFQRHTLGDLSYIVKLDVDGLEEQIIDGGLDVIGGASFIVIEASIGRQDLCSRAALLEKCGFRIFDICDNAYYYGQLALVDLVLINNRLRDKEMKFQPWKHTAGKVVWNKWQHGFKDFENVPADNPYEGEP